MRLKSRFAHSALILMFIFFFLAFAAGFIARQALVEQRMLDKMMRFANTSASRVKQEEYPKLAHSITGYLKGDLPTAQVEVKQGDRLLPAFSDNEILHLQDIKGLIGLAFTLQSVALTLLMFSLIFGFYLKKKKDMQPGFLKLRFVFLWSAGLIFALFSVIVLWGLANFEGLFYAFHKLVFRNDLWLLDPQSDLLLQLMPLNLFISYGIDIIRDNIILLTVFFLALIGFYLFTRNKRKVCHDIS